MDLTYHYVSDILIVDISKGDGGYFTPKIDDFIDELFKLNKENSKKIAFDLSKMVHLNSSGLGELLKIKDNIIDKGIELILINPSQNVCSLLKMVGVDGFFKILKNESDINK